MSDDSKTCDLETFVYDSKEVVKTGRTAIKKSSSGRRGKIKIYHLVEVCPVDMVGNKTRMFHSWVEEKDLCHICGTDITIVDKEEREKKIQTIMDKMESKEG